MKKLLKNVVVGLGLVTVSTSLFAKPITADLNGDVITYNGNDYIITRDIPQVSKVDWFIDDVSEEVGKNFNLIYSLKDAKKYLESPEKEDLFLSDQYKAYIFYSHTLGLNDELIKNGAMMVVKWEEKAKTTRTLGNGILIIQDGKSLPSYYSTNEYSKDTVVLQGQSLSNVRLVFYNTKGGKVQIYNGYTNELLKELDAKR